MVVTIKRTIKEGYISHLIYIPLVLITRGAGYLRGMVRYLFSPQKDA